MANISEFSKDCRYLRQRSRARKRKHIKRANHRTNRRYVKEMFQKNQDMVVFWIPLDNYELC